MDCSAYERKQFKKPVTLRKRMSECQMPENLNPYVFRLPCEQLNMILSWQE